MCTSEDTVSPAAFEAIVAGVVESLRGAFGSS